MAEGARLESVFRGNSNVGSNPTLSAIASLLPKITAFKSQLPDKRRGIQAGSTPDRLPSDQVHCVV